MSDEEVKKIKFKTISLELEQESDEVFPLENRISEKLSEREVLNQAIEMGMEPLVYNVVIPYRNAMHTLEKRYADAKGKLHGSGFMMIMDPFIPQYIGFEYVDDQGAGKSYYVKEDFVITSGIDNTWVVFSKSLNPTTIKIKNMYQGVMVLEALGANVSVDDYLDSQ